MRVFWITTVVVLIDQLSKFVVVRTMYQGQSIRVIGDWLKLTFTENPGMAFGITFGPRGLVTVLALAATVLITVYLYHLRGAYAPYRYSLAFILGGALGNIIDRIFYGVIYDYGPLFLGRVVDFIHVDVWRGYLQDILPFLGGAHRPIALFPIWNVADMAIVLGVVGILFFQRTFHERMAEAERQAREEASSESRATEDSASPATYDSDLSQPGTPAAEAEKEPADEQRHEPRDGVSN